MVGCRHATRRSSTSQPRSRTEPALQSWFELNGRDLLIRRTRSPWHVLVAEVMSQQTQIQRIGPAWLSFTGRWPTPEALARASTGDVLDAWAGLGYNGRALRLRDAARVICARHGGAVPRAIDELERLPGVGPYTARAIAAHAFGIRVAPLDVNVRRVLSRLAGTDAATLDLQEFADRLVWPDDPAAWANAMMDLAVLVCTPRRPACEACPLAGDCPSRGLVPDAAADPRTTPAFPTTNRWLRGELLRRLRAVPRGEWADVDGPIGVHAADDVDRALRRLEREGFLERAGASVRISP